MEKEFVTLKLTEIKPYPNNPRINDDAVQAVIESIKQCENLDPIEIDEENVILAGHTRFKALKKLKFKETECIRYIGLTEEQKRKYRLLSNKTGENALWDEELLRMELEGLDFEGFDFGFDLDEENEEPEAQIVDDKAPDEAEPRCKLGDVWILGDHRLICGDSTDAAVLEKLLDGQIADLMLTDPPYGISVVSGDKSFGKVGGENIVKSHVYSTIIGDDTTDTARANYDVALACTDNQIIFGGNYFTDFLPPSRCWIVWDKQNTGNFADAELAWTSFDKGVKLYHYLWNGLCREGSRKVEGKTRVHPTQKPVGMLADILKDFTKEYDCVLDCFGGSGSTLIACEHTGRICYICELDPHYCDVIIQRWENLTGGVAHKDEIESNT